MDSQLLNATPSSEISVLFLPNLELQEDPKSIEEKLKNNRIVNVEHLRDVEVQDLTSIGVSFSDACVVVQQAKKVLRQSESSQLQFKDVSSWLKANALERLEPTFSNIPMKIIPFIRRSDLIVYLGFSMMNTENILNKTWEAIQQLKRVFPPPIQPMDETAELICTTKKLPITVDLNEANFLNMLASSNELQNSIKVSFVGDTGTGKSLILSQLLSFDDRIRNARGPRLAAPEHSETTTNNVCLYTTTSRDGRHSFFLLDFEGAFGPTPHALREVWKKTWDLISSQSINQMAIMEKQRDDVVKTIFPQLAYLLSNIVILVDKQPPHHTGYLERLIRFTEVTVQNPGAGEKPFLIVIQNFANPENQKPDSNAYIIDQSTADFNECILRQRKAQELLQHFREICFIRIPSWSSHPLLFDQQICLLQGRLATYAEILKKESFGATNSWNDNLWFKYVKLLCEEFKQSAHVVNVPKLLASLHKHQTPLYQRVLNVWQLIWTPPSVGCETNRKQIEDNWAKCCDIVLKHFAFFLIEELQNQFHCALSCDDLKNKKYKETIVPHVSAIHNEIYRYSPCLALLPNEKLCGIAKAWHTTGHYGSRSGSHEGPPLPFGIHGFVVSSIKELLNIPLAQRVEKIFNLLRQGLQLKSPEERKLLSTKWIPHCFICSKSFTRDRPVKMLRCSHVVCEKCIEQPPIFCLFHEDRFNLLDFKKRLPGYSHPRVLSLDGGGVRGIVLIRILETIEKTTSYKINELFDLIVGSGIGGVIALIIALKKESPSYFVEYFLDYSQKIFKNDTFTKIEDWDKYKYDSKSLIATMKELFGETIMSKCSVPEYPLVAVSAYRKSSPWMGPIFFTNYVHEIGLEETREFAGRRLIHNCQVWQAAAVSATTPPLFPPHLVGEDEYIDGSFVVNNPSAYALREAKNVWNQRVDCLISIGTGFCQSTPRRGDTQLKWMDRVVDLVKETVDTDEKLCKNYESEANYYARLNPELKSTVNLDSPSRSELLAISSETNQYLTNNPKLRSICQRLLAVLLYVSEIHQGNNEKSAKLHICSRRLPFRVPSTFSGQWKLSCNVVKGNFTSKIEYTGIQAKNPLAYINLDRIENGDIVEIECTFGEEGNQKHLISGGRITLTPPYPLSTRPPLQISSTSSSPLLVRPTDQPSQLSASRRSTIDIGTGSTSPPKDISEFETVIRSPIPNLKWQSFQKPTRFTMSQPSQPFESPTRSPLASPVSAPINVQNQPEFVQSNNPKISPISVPINAQNQPEFVQSNNPKISPISVPINAQNQPEFVQSNNPKISPISVPINAQNQPEFVQPNNPKISPISVPINVQNQPEVVQPNNSNVIPKSDKEVTRTRSWSKTYPAKVPIKGSEHSGNVREKPHKKLPPPPPPGKPKKKNLNLINISSTTSNVSSTPPLSPSGTSPSSSSSPPPSPTFSTSLINLSLSTATNTNASTPYFSSSSSSSSPSSPVSLPSSSPSVPTVSPSLSSISQPTENSEQTLTITSTKPGEESLIERGMPWQDLKIENTIQYGVYGITYDATYKGTRVIVKKLLFDETSHNQQTTHSFAKELEVLIKLNHPNIAKLIGGWIARPYVCIVTEYSGEGSLYDLLHKRKVKLSTQQQFDFALKIAEGMEYLHTQRPMITHLDLRSQNILLHNGVPKIAEFGLSQIKKLLSVSYSYNEEIKWLPSDFVQEEQKCPDKLDVWLYGNLLYEIITNTNLYLNPLQMFDEDSSFQDQPFLTGDETHPILLTLMKQCWNLDPEQRPAFFQIVQTLKVANITSSDISQNQ